MSILLYITDWNILYENRMWCIPCFSILRILRLLDYTNNIDIIYVWGCGRHMTGIRRITCEYCGAGCFAVPLYCAAEGKEVWRCRQKKQHASWKIGELAVPMHPLTCVKSIKRRIQIAFFITKIPFRRTVSAFWRIRRGDARGHFRNWGFKL